MNDYPHLVLPSGLFPSGFLIKALYVFSFWPQNSTCPAHLTLLDLLTWIILCKKYQMCAAYWGGSVCSRVMSGLNLAGREAEFFTILSLPPSQAQTTLCKFLIFRSVISHYLSCILGAATGRKIVIIFSCSPSMRSAHITQVLSQYVRNISRGFFLWHIIFSYFPVQGLSCLRVNSGCAVE